MVFNIQRYERPRCSRRLSRWLGGGRMAGLLKTYFSLIKMLFFIGNFFNDCSIVCLRVRIVLRSIYMYQKILKGILKLIMNFTMYS